jgi:hypothetical protein
MSSAAAIYHQSGTPQEATRGRTGGVTTLCCRAMEIYMALSSHGGPEAVDVAVVQAREGRPHLTPVTALTLVSCACTVLQEVAQLRGKLTALISVCFTVIICRFFASTQAVGPSVLRRQCGVL